MAWKVNGFATQRKDGERFSDHRRRYFADQAIAAIAHERHQPSAICNLP